MELDNSDGQSTVHWSPWLKRVFRDSKSKEFRREQSCGFLIIAKHRHSLNIVIDAISVRLDRFCENGIGSNLDCLFARAFESHTSHELIDGQGFFAKDL